MCFSSHLHALARWGIGAEAEPDAASGRLPWLLRSSYSSQLGRALHYLPKGTREQMMSQSWLQQSRGLL